MIVLVNNEHCHVVARCKQMINSMQKRSDAHVPFVGDSSGEHYLVEMIKKNMFCNEIENNLFCACARSNLARNYDWINIDEDISSTGKG